MSEPTKTGREQFEAWLIQQKAVGEMIDAMWLAWQAGRESMRAEMVAKRESMADFILGEPADPGKE